MHPDLDAVCARQCGVFTHQQALGVGYSAHEVRRLVASREWTRLRRGVLTATATLDARRASTRATHLLRAAAAIAAVRDDFVLSHRTAALAWQLPLVGPDPERVALTTEKQHRRAGTGLELHTARTPRRHRAEVDGLPVTSAARTVCDLARSLPPGPAVAAADAAQQRGLVGLDDLAATYEDCRLWPGSARIKRLLTMTDRLAESPGESLSRVALRAAGLPAPTLQGELVLEGRRLRVDFLWPDRRLVGEFDGRVKYGSAEDLWAEKQREDLLRRNGFGVVRWIWSELHPEPRVMIERVRAALGRRPAP